MWWFDHETNKLLKGITERLDSIIRLLSPVNITHFTLKEGPSMIPIAPGFSPQFTATPLPLGNVTASGNVPVMTSSDIVNAPLTVDSTGLVGTVNIPASAVVGTSFTLTVTYTNPGGKVANGSATFTIIRAVPADIDSFTIAQSA